MILFKHWQIREWLWSVCSDLRLNVFIYIEQSGFKVDPNLDAIQPI